MPIKVQVHIFIYSQSSPRLIPIALSSGVDVVEILGNNASQAMGFQMFASAGQGILFCRT